MSQAGAVRWRIRRPQSSIEREVSANTLLVPMIVHTSAGTRRVAIDLRDQGDSYHDPALEWADSYVKRSLDPAVRHPAHVEPMGIHFPCRTSGATWPLIRAIAGQCAREGASGARRIWNYLHLPQPSWYEQLPEAPQARRVVFQTRAWHPEEAASTDEAEYVNGQRVELIRRLRAAFGNRFVGGLIPTAYAVPEYPQEVVTKSYHVRDYIAMSKASRIGVYTRGLHGSTAFKFAEYLAGTQCIVADPPQHTPSSPLIAGTHYLPFATIDQCLDACARLLEDDQAAHAMRYANARYYAKEVAPKARLSRILRISQSTEGAASTEHSRASGAL